MWQKDLAKASGGGERWGAGLVLGKKAGGGDLM